MNASQNHDRSLRGSLQRRTVFALFALIAVGAFAALTATAAVVLRPNAGAPAETAVKAGLPLPPAAAAVERGRYLVATSGCHDCHTPWVMSPEGPGPDMTRALSGHPEDLVMPAAPDLGGGPWVWAGAGTNTAFAGPWGVSFTANLTPDPSGLGAWDEEIFARALRTGKHMGQSRPILPPMPWPVYRNMTDADLKAIFAYLRTIPPVSNHVPEPLPPGSGTAEVPGTDPFWTTTG